MAPKPVTYTFRPCPHHLGLVICDVCSSITDDPDGHAAWHEGNPVKKKDAPRVTVQTAQGTKVLK